MSSSNCCALVTGGSRGIGRQIVKKLIQSEKWISSRESTNNKTIIYFSKNEQSVHTAMHDFIRYHHHQTNYKKRNNKGKQLRLIGFALDVKLFTHLQSNNTLNDVTPLKILEWQSNSHDSGENEIVTKGFQSLNQMFKKKSEVESFPLPKIVIQSHGIAQEKLAIGYKSSKDVLDLVNTNFVSNVMINNYFIKKWMPTMKNSATTTEQTKEKKLIINISSILGTQRDLNLPGTSIYSAMKLGLDKYTTILNKELINYKDWLSVKCYSPCLVTDTDMIKNLRSNEKVSTLLHTLSNSGDSIGSTEPLAIESKTSDMVATDIMDLVEDYYTKR